jgi:thioredoxin-like negative regulator of GroEL
MSHSAGAHNANHYDITTPQELTAILRQSTGRTVIRFYRQGCPACDAITGPWLEVIRRPENSCHTFVSVDTADSHTLGKAFNIQYVPTFVSIERGHQGVALTGANPEKLGRLIATGSL